MRGHAQNLLVLRSPQLSYVRTVTSVCAWICRWYVGFFPTSKGSAMLSQSKHWFQRSPGVPDLLHCPCVIKVVEGIYRKPTHGIHCRPIYEALEKTTFDSYTYCAWNLLLKQLLTQAQSSIMIMKLLHLNVVTVAIYFLCLKIVCINLCGVVFSEFQQIKVWKAHVCWSCGSNYLI